MTRITSISVRVLFVFSFLAMLTADWFLLGTGLGFITDFLGFFGFVTFGMFSAISLRQKHHKLAGLVLLLLLTVAWINLESESEWLGYRLYLARHGETLESVIKPSPNATSPDSVLQAVGVHASCTNNNALALMIANDDFNSQGCLIYSPDSAPSHQILYNLGLHWIHVEPRHLVRDWYYCEEAVQ